MTQTQIYYRLRIRDEDDTTDVLVLSSHPGDANALLCEAPDGDGTKLDPIMGTLEVGSYTWQAIDRFDGGDTYTITSLLSDVDARNQLLSHKCVGEYSTDGSAWNHLHTGYVNDIKLSDAKTYTFAIGDTDRRERDAVLFKTITDTFDRVSNIIGGPVEADTPVAYQGTPTRAWGPILDYGPARMQVIANPSGLVNPSNRITLSLTGGILPPRYLGFQSVWNGKVPNPAEYIDQQTYQYYEADADGIYATDGSQQSQPWGSFPQLQVKLTKVSDASVVTSFPIAQAARKASSYVTWPGGSIPDYPKGDEKALVANSNDWLIVAWDTGTMGSAPSVGTAYDVLVRPLVISEDNPMHLRGHPVDLHIAANTDQSIPYDAASASATKTALGPLFYELRITEPWEYSKFVEMLKGSAGYATRYNAAGEQEFFQTRMTQPAAVATVTTANIIGDDHGEPAEVIFDVNENSAIKGVDFKLQQYRLWNKDTDSASDRPVDGVVAKDVTITGTRRDDGVKGDKIITFEVPGMIMLAGGALVLNQPMALRAWIEDAGNVIIDRAGWGWPEGEIEVLSTVAGQVGDYWDLEAPHQVNAKTDQSPVTQRGGTRRVQIVSRTEMPGTYKAKVKDAGNVAQTAPVAPDNGGTEATPALVVPELSLAPSADNPFTIATVTETNVADLQDIGADTELQYLVQTATPASTDEGEDFGPLASSAGTDTIDAPAIASGQTIWVRGRAFIAALAQRGDWSTWISITLGPDDDGTGSTLPPFLLALQVDASGILAATANSVDAAITTVYFLAGPAGGAAPLFDAVLAGTVDSSGPDFGATGLATMAEGEVRTVGAVGEDALGNRTVLITATITRALATGADTGASGDFVITLRTTPPLVLVGDEVGTSTLVEPPEAKADRIWRSLTNTNLLGVQGGSGRAGGDGVVGGLMYSLTGDEDSFVALGPEWSLADVAYPSLGTPVAIDATAKAADIVCLSWGTKGGDGSTTAVEVGNINVSSFSAATTPEPTEPVEPPAEGPPPPPLPSGSPFPDIIDDRNAVTLGATLIDGAAVTAWPDDSANNNVDAVPSGSDGQVAPIYRTAGLTGGLPCVEFTAASSHGLKIIGTQITGSSFTLFGLIEGIGTPGGSGVAAIWSSPEGHPFQKGWTALDPGAFSGDAMGVYVPAGPTFDNFPDTWTRSGLHVYCFSFDVGSGATRFYVDDMTTPVSSFAGSPQISAGTNVWIAYQSGLAPVSMKVGRFVTYNGVMTSGQRATVRDGILDGADTGTFGGGLLVVPGLYGFGTTTAAGRGGAVIRVTNLNDSGPGSLRAACAASGARTIVFEVSGTIHLASKIVITNPLCTIAGQSAPSPGILLRGYGISVHTSDVLIQHLRIRVGKPVLTGNNDCIEALGPGAQRVVVDHCSLSWGTDENGSAWFTGTPGAASGAQDITFADCIISENFGSGGMLVGDYSQNVLLLRNLMAHNADRDPYIKSGTAAAVVNNLIYNFGGNEPTTIANPDPYGSGASLASVVGNAYKRGPSLSGGYPGQPIHVFASVDPGSQLYVSDNRESGVNGGLPPSDPWDLVNNDVGGGVVASSPPVWPNGLTAASSGTIITGILTNSGAWASARDAVDTRVVASVNAGTGAVITDQASVGGFPTIAENTRTMEDAGMPADPTTDTDMDGYTDLEEWLQGLSDDAAGL